MTGNDCQNVFALLSEYIDRDLPPGTCEELDRHIQGCAPCVEFVESLRKSVALGRTYSPGVEAPPVPEALKEALRKAYAKSLNESET
jgi:RNA polymerase sigma-70 factor (ECF subfamily)